MAKFIPTRPATGDSALGCALVLLIIGKLSGLIDISWWWVLAPIWLPWSLLAALGITVFIVTATVELLRGRP